MDRDLSNAIFEFGMRRLLASLLTQAAADSIHVSSKRALWTPKADTYDGVTVLRRTADDIQQQAQEWLLGDDARAIASALGIAPSTYQRVKESLHAKDSDWRTRVVLGCAERAA